MISLQLIERLQAKYPELTITTEETPRSVIVNGTAISVHDLLQNDILERFHNLAPAQQEDVLATIAKKFPAKAGKVEKAPEPKVEEPAPVAETVVETEPETVVVAGDAPVEEVEAPKKKASKKTAEE